MLVRMTDDALTPSGKIYVWVMTAVGAKPSLTAMTRRTVVVLIVSGAAYTSPVVADGALPSSV